MVHLVNGRCDDEVRLVHLLNGLLRPIVNNGAVCLMGITILLSSVRHLYTGASHEARGACLLFLRRCVVLWIGRPFKSYRSSFLLFYARFLSRIFTNEGRGVVTFQNYRLRGRVRHKVVCAIRYSGRLSNCNVRRLRTSSFYPNRILSVTVQRITERGSLASNVITDLLLHVSVLRLRRRVLVILRTVLLRVRERRSTVSVGGGVFYVRAIRSVVNSNGNCLTLRSVELTRLACLVCFIASCRGLLKALGFIAPDH